MSPVRYLFSRASSGLCVVVIVVFYLFIFVIVVEYCGNNEASNAVLYCEINRNRD